MSEYQYYEFVAIDRPLDRTQMDELRAISTRAEIGPSSFINSYEWGDFKGDPRVMMERYFDAFLYLANWGTHRVMFRLPARLLDPAIAEQYCVGDSAQAWNSGEHVILDLSNEDDSDEDWEEGEGLLASIVAVRSELAAGDLRALYLAWLGCIQAEELDEDALEPPVPLGLNKLSAALHSLASFLRIDEDLLAVAAAVSQPRTVKSPSSAALSRWVQALPSTDKDAALLRVLRGDDAHLRTELLRRFQGQSKSRNSKTGLRSVGQLLDAANARRAPRSQ